MLKGYKTYITAGVAVITALAAYLTGEATAMQSVTLIFNALMGAFIRHSI